MTEGLQTEELEAVAIIGMACRYPGADNLEAFWRNLKEGVESISLFSDEELADVVPEELLKHENYVKTQGVLEDIDKFDAGFFGLTPMEAGLMNPTQRLLLEVAWHALEHSGYNPETHGKSTAVFAGADRNEYETLLTQNPVVTDSTSSMQLMIGNGPDHLTPRLSYLLNLRGPSVPVQTACSTSLVAIHMACQNLLAFESNMALAGGVSVQVPQKTGYYYEPGGALSADGRCRAFDASSTGTTVG